MKKFYTLSFAVLSFILAFSLKSTATVHAVQIAPGGQPVFSPNTLTMCVGDTILFGMASNTTHNVHILTPVDSTSFTMNTTGQFFGYVPTSAGLYSYQCDFHAGMGMTGAFTVNTIPTATTNSVTDVDCFGSSTGAIDITAAGGSLTYLWSNSATTQDVSGLAAGTYSVVVSNTCGSDTITGIVVNTPTGIVPSIVGADLVCNGDADGSANLTVSGGTPSYTFLWSNAATTEDITGLSGGTYSVTVTDANGCTASASIVINEPAAISIPASVTLPSCNGDCDGSITAAPTGGTGAYTYMWMPGMATTASITGLCADTYTVDVTDASGCTASSAVVLNEPGVLSATISPFDVGCNGGNNGSMDLTVAGGTSPFTFAWSNAATTEDISGLTAGTYSVLVTDASGCTTTASAGIAEPSKLLYPEQQIPLSMLPVMAAMTVQFI